MEFYLVIEGERKGPLGLLEVQELLDEGRIHGETKGWTRGMGEWVPIREIGAIEGVIQSLEKKRLHEELDRVRTKQAATPPPLPHVPEIPYEKLASHGVARFGARMIDVLLVECIILTLLPAIPAEFPQLGTVAGIREYIQQTIDGTVNPEVVQFAYQAFWIQTGGWIGYWLVEALLLSLVGWTPGKLLFRLSVVGRDGQRLRFPQALGRSFLAFWIGLGGRLPLVSLVTCFLAFRRLQGLGTTYWDQLMNSAVHQGPMTRGRVLISLVLFGLVAFYVMQARPTS